MSAQTSTSIEISKSRDGSVTVMVTGKAANVSEAKVRLQKDLQTNVSVLSFLIFIVHNLLHVFSVEG